MYPLFPHRFVPGPCCLVTPPPSPVCLKPAPALTNSTSSAHQRVGEYSSLVLKRQQTLINIFYQNSSTVFHIYLLVDVHHSPSFFLLPLFCVAVVNINPASKSNRQLSTHTHLITSVCCRFREMCLWDVNDGRCIEFTKLACAHTGIQVTHTHTHTHSHTIITNKSYLSLK